MARLGYHIRIDENPVKGGYTISALTRRDKETASQNMLRWKSENDSSKGLGRSVMSHCGICQQITFVLILFSLWEYVEAYFAEPDTTLGVYNLLWTWRRNPPCNAEDNLRAGLVVIEAWFRGY